MRRYRTPGGFVVLEERTFVRRQAARGQRRRARPDRSPQFSAASVEEVHMASSGGIGFSTLNSDGGLTTDEMKRIQRLIAEEDKAIKAGAQSSQPVNGGTQFPASSLGDIPVVLV